MNEKQDSASAATPKSSRSAVSLVIDYGNDVQKSFSNIPWTDGMAVLDMLDEVRSKEPGLKCGFSSTFTDRGGNNVWVLGSIDDVVAATEDQSWMLWINQDRVGRKIRSRASLSDTQRIGGGRGPVVKAGDVVTLKLTTRS